MAGRDVHRVARQLAMPLALVAGQGMAAETSSTTVREGTGQPALQERSQPIIGLAILDGWVEQPHGDLVETMAEDLEPGGASEETTQEKAEGQGEWLVAPIPFKNPLLGAGLKLGVARIYHPGHQGPEVRDSMFGVGGMFAEGDSWAAAAGDRRYLFDGRVRTTVGGGAGEFYYDLSVNVGGNSVPLSLRQGVRGGMVDVDFNVLEHGWLGGGLRYAESPVKGPIDESVPQELVANATFRISALALRFDWDSRSDEFYPLGGTLAGVGVDISASDSVFQDSQFVRYELEYNGYQAVAAQHVLAWRAAFYTVSGDAPFFAFPWYGTGADLRGYTPGRYIGRSLAAAQLEWRWQATRKLGAVAFAGIGGVYGEVPLFEQADSLPAGGVGLRWRLVDENPINFRIDYGWGKDDETLIISVGEAF